MRCPRLLIVAALLGAAACRPKTPTPPDAGPPLTREWLEGLPLEEHAAPREGGTLTVRAMAEPAGLNLLDDAFRDAWAFRLTRNLVVEALVEIDPRTMALKPQLATSWVESDDHRTVTFALRQGVTFHDGAKFTARDVVATLDAVADPKRPTGNVRGDLGELQSWKAAGDFSVALTWRTTSPFALRKVAQLPIYPASAVQGDWATLAAHPVGTGPYRFEAWERGQRVTLTCAERWWGGAVHLDRIVFRVVKDHAVAATLFERGEFDVMTSIQPSLWRAMEAPDGRYAWAQVGWRRLKSVDNSYSYIAWNEERPLFADPRVRRALAHLYPAELVSRSIDQGLELPTTCPFWARSGKCDPGVTALPFSPATAKAELLDAGFADSDGDGVLDRDGVAARFHFLIPAASVRLGKLVPLLQEQARLAGVDVQLEKADSAVLSARVARRDFDAISRVWTEFDSEVDQFPVFHSSQADGGNNFAGYASPEADRLMEAVRGEWDAGARGDLERALHRRLYADQPYLFMTVRQSLDAARPTVHGLWPSLTWYDLRQVWVDAPRN